LKSDGTVRAWGRSVEGQTTVPAGLSGVTAIAAGGLHSLALKSDGTVVAWGSNSDGQATVPAGLTTQTAQLASVNAPASDGTNGIVVLNTANPNLAPGMLVTGAGITSGAFIVSINVDNKTLTLSEKNIVLATQTSVSLTISSSVVAIAAGYYHNLALRSNGTVVAWGRNVETQSAVPSSCTAYYGLTANFPSNGSGTAKTATLLTANSNIVANMRVFGPQPNPVAYVGRNGSVGVGAKVVTNVSNTNLTFDKSNTNTLASPAAAPSTYLTFLPVKEVKSIAAGYSHSVARMSDGTVVSWGTGVDSTYTSGWTGVTAIAAGDYFTLGLNSSNGVWAVGSDTNGQVSGAAALSGIAAIAAGGEHAVALTSVGTVLAWGKITKDGVNFISESVPAALSGVPAFPTGASVTAITAGGDHTGVIAVGPPIILIQPEGASIAVGGSANFSVTAMNATGYQWRKDGVNIPGANSSTLSLTNVQSPGVYTVMVTNAASGANGTLSNSASIGMITRPTVTSQPLDVRVRLTTGSVHKVDKNLVVDEVNQTKYYDVPLAANTVTFEAKVSGGGVTYKWLKNGVAIPLTLDNGANTEVLTLTNVTTLDAGSYTLVATNSLGSVTSRSAMLRVDPLGIISIPQITSNLWDLSLPVRAPMTYTITANTITATTPAADKPSYAASGLPKGLKINSKTGVISGTPTKLGTYLVTLQAKKKATGTASATLRVVVRVPTT
jgi:alpha-tubulin suppressor-like RCC1 family protein